MYVFLDAYASKELLHIKHKYAHICTKSHGIDDDLTFWLWQCLELRHVIASDAISMLDD